MDSTNAAMPEIPREERGLKSEKFGKEMKVFLSNVKFSKPLPPPSRHVTARQKKWNKQKIKYLLKSMKDQAKW